MPAANSKRSVMPVFLHFKISLDFLTFIIRTTGTNASLPSVRPNVYRHLDKIKTVGFHRLRHLNEKTSMRTTILSLLLFFAFSSFGQKKQLTKFSSISIDSMGDLKWTTTFNEDLFGLNVNVEKQKGDKWVFVGRAKGAIFGSALSTPKTQFDSTRVKFHTGINVYRLVMTQPEQLISEEIKLESKTSNDDGSLWIVSNTIILDNNTHYEILDQNGSTILKGEGRKIDIASLANGSYFFYTKGSTIPFNK